MNSVSITQRDPSSYAGSYEILKAELFSNNNNDNSIDIRRIINKITIRESLYRAGIGVEIRIDDGINLLDNIKLLGNEKIFLEIVQQGKDQSLEKKFSIELYISNVTDFSRPKPGLDAYSLICVSKHVYLNQFTILGDGFQSTVGKNIENILTSHLGFESKSPLMDIYDGGGEIKGVYPSLKPIEAIVFQKEASSEYLYFYQTIKGKVHLSAHTDLLKKDIIGEYTTSPYYNNALGDVENYKEQQKKVLKFSSDLDISKLKAVSNGVYSSESDQIDISLKTYERPESAISKQRLNKGPSNSRKNTFFEFENKPQSRRYTAAINSKAYGNKSNYHVNHSSIPNNESYKHDLNTHKARISVYGNIDISVGNTLQLNVPPTGIAEVDQSLDQYFTGKYLITDIIHTFTNEYIQDMVIKKDSFIVDTDNNMIEIERKA